MKKYLWALAVIVLVVYSAIVWSWIQEGNHHFTHTGTINEPLL